MVPARLTRIAALRRRLSVAGVTLGPDDILAARDQGRR